MDADWAAQRLGEIRTLMERSALYRRALAPTMTGTGVIGILAGWIGWTLPIQSGSGFCFFWMTTGVMALLFSFFLIRRQAWKDNEPMWSTPTRRVFQALCPALFAGCVIGFLGVSMSELDKTFLWKVPPLWMMFYGCALFSAGFFMHRGIKLFGTLFVLCGVISIYHFTRESVEGSLPRIVHAHIVMGASFGILHLFYGIYLFLTEPQPTNQP